MMKFSQSPQKGPGSPRKRSPRKLIPRPVRRKNSQAASQSASRGDSSTLHHFFAKQAAKVEAQRSFQANGTTSSEALVIADSDDEAAAADDDDDVERKDLPSRLAKLSRQLFSPTRPPCESQEDCRQTDHDDGSEAQAEKTVPVVVYAGDGLSIKRSSVTNDQLKQVGVCESAASQDGAVSRSISDPKPKSSAVVGFISPLKESCVDGLDDDDTNELMGLLPPEVEVSPSSSSTSSSPTKRQNHSAQTFRHAYLRVVGQGLLAEDDLARLDKFFRADERAQELWLRLYQRKQHWISRSRISYSIDFIDSVLADLVQLDFLRDKSRLTDMKTLLDLLPQRDVIALGRKFCDGKKCTTKGASIDELVAHAGRKDTLFGGQRIREHIVKSGRQLLEQCYLVDGSLAATVTRVLVLFSMGSHFDTFTTAAEKNDYGVCNLYTLGQFMRGTFVFPEYSIAGAGGPTAGDTATVLTKLFGGADDFRLYCDARLHVFRLARLIETGNWDEALARFEESFEWFVERSRSSSSSSSSATSGCATEGLARRDAGLPSFLHRFTYSHCVLRCLAAGAEILERQKRYRDAVDIYCTILGQTTFSMNRRGLYWIRLLLDVDAHLKLPRNSIALAALALDDDLAAQHKFDVYTRAKRLSERFGVPLPQLERFCPPTDAPVETIEGALMKRDIIGRRNVFASADGTLDGEKVVGPEAVAIEHYLRHGFTNGVHGETRTIHMLFALLCWDVLFGAPSEVEPVAAPPRGKPLTLDAEVRAIESLFPTKHRDAAIDISDDDDGGGEDCGGGNCDAEGGAQHHGQGGDAGVGQAPKKRGPKRVRGSKKASSSSSKRAKKLNTAIEVKQLPRGRFFRPDIFPVGMPQQEQQQQQHQPQRCVELQKAVYVNEYQSGPLDLGYAEFYLNRRQAIEEHLAALAAMSSAEIVEVARTNYELHSGRVNPLFSWDLLSADEAVALISCIRVDVMVAICRRLLVEFRHYRSGFPDVIMWNEEARRWKVVEVKGPGDILSTKQKYWMHLLLSLGVDCVTCRVVSVHSRKIRP